MQAKLGSSLTPGTQGRQPTPPPLTSWGTGTFFQAEMSQQSRWGLGWEAGWPGQKHPFAFCSNSCSIGHSDQPRAPFPEGGVSSAHRATL